MKYRAGETGRKMDRGYSTKGGRRTVTGGKEEEDEAGGGGGGARCQDENLTNSASDTAEVKGTQPKKVKDEIKARRAAVPGGTAENLSLQGKATADARQTRS